MPEVIRRENQLFKVFLIVSWLFPGLQHTLNVPWDPRSVRRGDRGWCSVTDPGSWNLGLEKLSESTRPSCSPALPCPRVPQQAEVALQPPPGWAHPSWDHSSCHKLRAVGTVLVPIFQTFLLEAPKPQIFPPPLLCLLDNSGSPRLGTSPGSTGGPTLLLGGHQSIRGSVSPMR